MNALTQFYSVDLLDFGKNRVYEFDHTTDAAVQMIPLNAWQAQLIVTNRRNAMDGVQSFHETIKGGILRRIEYTIIGSPDQKKVGIQRYKHDFKKRVQVEPDAANTDLGLIYTPDAYALFVPYEMNVLLDTNEFTKVTAIQFIA